MPGSKFSLEYKLEAVRIAGREHMVGGAEASYDFDLCKNALRRKITESRPDRNVAILIAH